VSRAPAVNPADAGPMMRGVAERALDAARRAGATHAEVVIENGRAFSVRVQGGQIDTLKQSTTHGLGLRVIVGDAIGFVSTTDFRGDTLADLARRAVALARFATPDGANAFPTPVEAGIAPDEDMGLYDPAMLDLAPAKKIEMALTLERLALAHDQRIKRTEGAGVSSHDGASLLANSHGLVRFETGTSASLYVIPLADDRDGKQQAGYFSQAVRAVADLPSLEAAALEAAERAVARIGARTVPSARVPVVMHPDVAGAWISEIHGAFSGEAVIKNQSWLSQKLGETIASPLVTLVDDGVKPGGLGSSPYDGEGIATRRNVLIDRGRCAMFLYDLYHARRAGTRPTGSAVRSYGSPPGIGATNLYLEAGADSPEAILAKVDRGFYMDDQGSFGFNDVTGDYSFQAQGFWIEAGRKAFPVEGITVASNSLEMLEHVVAVGSDLEFRHSIASPTLLIAEMTVSGSG
jgi:PmbA protein